MARVGWQDLYDLHGADSIVVEDAYRQLFERELPRLVAELGGGEYQPSSPHNQEADHPRESGDQHDWGVWFGKAGFEFYTEEAGRLPANSDCRACPTAGPWKRLVFSPTRTRSCSSGSAARWSGWSPASMGGT